MSLRDLNSASIKSPSGQVIPFDYEDLESHVEKKTSVFESTIGNGTYVQSSGHTSRRLPMACFFHGDDYDLKAEAFLSALLEDGEFTLSHPVHGDINVVPVGQVTRLDALKTAAKQVVYSVSFYETTGLQIGDSGGLPQAFDDLMQASALDFSEKAVLDDPVDKESFKNKVTALKNIIQDKMKAASGAVASVNQAIEDAGDSIGRGLDLLVGEPLTLARQVQLLIGEPRRQNSSVNAKLDAYRNFATNIFAGTVAEPSRYQKEAENTFSLNRLVAHASLGNMAMLMTESTQQLTKSEYVAQAELMISLLEQYQSWHDENFASLTLDEFAESNTDTGDGVLELQALIMAVCAELIKRSFSAATEMRETLTRDEALIPLCYRKMGSGEGAARDLFVAMNKFELDELLMIPNGREIVWYV